MIVGSLAQRDGDGPISIPTFASAGNEGDAKASNSSDEALIARFPRRSLWLKKRQTSGMR
mgnify:CR=1 FL=1